MRDFQPRADNRHATPPIRGLRRRPSQLQHSLQSRARRADPGNPDRAAWFVDALDLLAIAVTFGMTPRTA
jgi:hypothetical protein